MSEKQQELLTEDGSLVGYAAAARDDYPSLFPAIKPFPDEDAIPARRMQQHQLFDGQDLVDGVAHGHGCVRGSDRLDTDNHPTIHTNRFPPPEKTPDNNPKSAFGMKKPAFHLIPQTALVILAKVMMLGAKKYGPYNWRDNSVAATVYVSAAQRHLASWFDGESIDPESGMSHLGHVMACCAIVLDAMATGNLIDDRPKAGRTAELIKEYTTND